MVGASSAGVATIRNGAPVVTKFATSSRHGDCIDRITASQEFEEKHKDCGVGIAHTRWATCGSKDDNNAHPHCDEDRSVYLVHNGTILNYRALKDDLTSRGVKFATETDTEVIAQLIAVEYKKEKDAKKSIKAALDMLEGTYGLVIMFVEEPEKLYCIEHGSHLVIGIGENEVFIGSEARAFHQYTQKCVELPDNQLVEIGKNAKGVYAILNTESNFSNPVFLKHGNALVEKGIFSTYFEKEICEQDEAVFNAIGKNSRIDTMNYTSKIQGLQNNQELLTDIEHICIFGCGTSNISSSIALIFFRMINNFVSVQVFDPSDFSENDIPKSSVGRAHPESAGHLHQPVRRNQRRHPGPAGLQEERLPHHGHLQRHRLQDLQRNRLRRIHPRRLRAGGPFHEDLPRLHRRPDPRRTLVLALQGQEHVREDQERDLSDAAGF